MDNKTIPERSETYTIGQYYSMWDQVGCPNAAGLSVLNDVLAYFIEMEWQIEDGLDTVQKKILFKLKFC